MQESVYASNRPQDNTGLRTGWGGTPTQAGAPRPTRVFVLHPYPAYRCGVVSVLANDLSMQCVGWADSVEEALHTAPVTRPEVLLADTGTGNDGVAALLSLHRLLPQAGLLLLEPSLKPLLLQQRGLKPGCWQFVARSASAAELVAAVRGAALGLQASQAQSRPLHPSPRDVPGADLTPRERALLTLMARGQSNREISANLGIAMPTVKFHVTNVLSKLQVENRTAAVLVALRHSLVTIN